MYERVHVARPLAEAGGEGAALSSDAVRALHAWNQVFSPGDQEAFFRRLRWDGLDHDTVVRALSALDIELSPVPDWTVWLDRILQAATQTALGVDGGISPDDLGLDPDQEPPFIEIGLVALRAARAALLDVNPWAYDALSVAARRALERQLLRDVCGVAAPTLYELFRRMVESPSEEATAPSSSAGSNSSRYDEFVRSLIDDFGTFWVAYPVLARLTARMLHTWVEAADDLTLRLEVDRAAIADQFNGGIDPGRVAELAPGLSDPHNGRRRVAALTFETGLRLIYKPRDVGIEQTLSSLLVWLDEHGCPSHQRVMSVLERKGYGWIEFIEQEPFTSVDEVRSYFHSAGGLACVAFLLGATDLHMDNVIATRGGPVIIDPESVMYPGRPLVTETNPQASGRSFERCTSTGFITFGEMGADGAWYETGGLRGTGLRGTARARRRWMGLRTDALTFVDEHEYGEPAANRVVLDGALQRPETFATEIARGFADTYRWIAGRRDELLAESGPIESFRSRRARVMFRPSNQYAVLQDVLLTPRYMSSGLRRSTAFDALARPFAMDRDRPVAWPVTVAERRALDDLDIPYFSVLNDATAVQAGEDVVGDRFFSRPGIDIARQRIGTMSEPDLALQLEWIDRSLSESATSTFRVPPPRAQAAPENAAAPTDTDRAARHIALAEWIGRELLDRAVTEQDALRWNLHLPGFVVSEVEEHALYGGTLGPAMFLGALAHITGNSAWADAARAAARPACRLAERVAAGQPLASAPIGIGVGVGSIVYTLRWLGTFLQDRSYCELAVATAARLDAPAMAADRDHDIVIGTAGAILALLSLEQPDNGALLDRAVAGGDHLVASQIHTHGGSNWPSRDRRLLAGFAHGAAGIAYALIRLYEVTGRRAYFDAALRAHRYERSVYSPASKNWPLVRSAGHLPGNVAVLMTAWCHGAPGIALARSLVRDVVIGDDPDIATEIDVALETTTALPGNAGDHLCCGNMGRADVLLTAGRRLERSATVDAAATLAGTIEQRALGRGRFQLVSPGFEYIVADAGFFHGVSGIGYELLRLAAPSRLPSILAFEGRVES